jgi:hypothetical protein
MEEIFAKIASLPSSFHIGLALALVLLVGEVWMIRRWAHRRE